MSTDVARMKLEIEKWEGKDGFSRYLDYLREAHLHYELSVTHVLRKNFTSLLSMARPSFLRHLLTLHPFESIYTRASKYFWTERLRRVFTFGSMYMGMSPFDAPGTYSLLQYTELAEGIWYPEGGFHRVISALVDIGKRLGVRYRLSTPVSSITLSPKDNRTATGVVLSTGETVTADIVILNADLVYAYNNLLPAPYSNSTRSTKTARSLKQRPASCSSISFYWSTSRKIPELSAHNIFLADAYRSSFDSIFKQHLIPAEPSFYVNVPSRIDPTAAPEGKDSIVVLVPVGHLTDNKKSDNDDEANTASTPINHNGTVSATSAQTPSDQKSPQDWDQMISTARQIIISTISTRLRIPDFASAITHEQLNSPLSWRDKFNLDRGAILGLSHSFFNVLCFRPPTRHSDASWPWPLPFSLPLPFPFAFLSKGGAGIKNLYFVGASTHPGTGVPICLAGAKVVSEQILGDWGVDVPWAGTATATATATGKEGKVKDIDQIRPPGPGFGILFLALFVLVVGMLGVNIFAGRRWDEVPFLS